MTLQFGHFQFKSSMKFFTNFFLKFKIYVNLQLKCYFLGISIVKTVPSFLLIYSESLIIVYFVKYA